jgi:hypothetical protein
VDSGVEIGEYGGDELRAHLEPDRAARVRHELEQLGAATPGGGTVPCLADQPLGLEALDDLHDSRHAQAREPAQLRPRDRLPRADQLEQEGAVVPSQISGGPASEVWVRRLAH